MHGLLPLTWVLDGPYPHVTTNEVFYVIFSHLGSLSDIPHDTIYLQGVKMVGGPKHGICVSQVARILKYPSAECPPAGVLE